MIGNRIRQLRKARGLTQQELADIAFLSVTTVVFLETGRRKPNEDHYDSLARALDMTINELKGIE